MTPDTIEVSEMFSSLQGEVRRCGYPATFLRLRRCNLACTWCDQKETWDPTNEGYNDYETLILWEVSERILDYGNNLLVITGGEPLIWQRQLKRLVESIPFEMSIEIETNGTVSPKDLSLTRTDFNVSPKLNNSGNGIRNTVMHPAFLDLYKRKKAVLKYVVSDPEDFEEIDWQVRNWGLNGNGIFIMPEGVDRDVICDRLPWLFEACSKRGFNLSSRLHVLAFGDMKGV